MGEAAVTITSKPIADVDIDLLSQTKVALRCSDEEELLLLQAQAQSLNLCARSIQDA